MKQPTPAQLRQLMRNPKAMMDYQMYGRVPRGERPDSPLITLLERYTPHDRLRIRGIRIASLGYTNSHLWQNAEQLYRWLKPSNEVFGSYPAGSYQKASFRKRLTPDDLKAASMHYPDNVKPSR